MRHVWTPDQERELRARYPDEPTEAIALDLALPTQKVYSKAAAMGLRKSALYFEKYPAGRIRKPGGRSIERRFKPGHEPWNKGKSYQPGGRSVETQFKKGEIRGQAQHNYKPIGSYRISKDGYLEQKTTDDHPVPARRWVAVHRLVWEAAHGPIPKGHAVVFKGERTRGLEEITIDRLELVTRAELMRRNTLHRYPKPIADAIRTVGVLRRQINKRERNEQRHRQPAG